MTPMNDSACSVSIQDILDGNTRAVARAISLAEDDPDQASSLLEELEGHTGNAVRIGITGPPGSGKSTLVQRLVQHGLDREYSVGVLAIDPSSPFSGGSLMGDRIRMHSLSNTEKLFIRSMASRGKSGGLAPATAGACDILDAAGNDVVLVETVGVGQNEVEIRSIVDTVVLVLTPESGDAIQTLKAGIMEIADLIIINKADRPAADRLEKELMSMLSARKQISDQQSREQKQPSVIKVSARSGEGIDDLVEELFSG